MAEIENIHCPICTQPIPSSWQNGLPPAFATLEQRGDIRTAKKAAVKWIFWLVIALVQSTRPVKQRTLESVAKGTTKIGCPGNLQFK